MAQPRLTPVPAPDDEDDDDFDQADNGRPDVPTDPFADQDAAPGPAWKVPPREVPADSMPVKVKVVDPKTGDLVDQTMFLHEGEAVWFAPAVSMGTLFTTAGLALYGSDGGREGARRMVESAQELFRRLADCVADWNLTGLDGAPLPKPWKNPDAFAVLTDDEIAWLVQELTGQEPKAARGNGSRGSSYTTGANPRRRQK